MLTLSGDALSDMSRTESCAQGPGFASYVPAILLVLISTVALGTAQMRPSDRVGDPVAVVFAPGTSLVQAIDEIAVADGTVVRAGAFSNIVVAVGSAPDFSDRLLKRGAWLVADPYGLGGCLLASKKAS